MKPLKHKYIQTEHYTKQWRPSRRHKGFAALSLTLFTAFLPFGYNIFWIKIQ